jgi:serine/threonine-protein kinase
MVAPVRIGSRLGGYRIETLVTSSPSGTVYRARRKRSDAPVALEVVAPELTRVEGLGDRLQRAGRHARSLAHPGIAPVHEVGETDVGIYVVSDWVEGVDLATLIDRMGSLSFLRAAGVAHQAAAALDLAHANQLVHGALEPRRLIVADEDGADRIVLTGFASVPDGASNGSGPSLEGWVGPPPAAYAAPEQISGGDVGPRADIYGLACVLYEAVVGEPPFVRETTEQTLRAHLEEEPPSPSKRALELPAAFDRVVKRALAKDPADRFGSASELARAALEAGGVVPPPEIGPSVGRTGVIEAWQRSLAAGARDWSPSAASRGAVTPVRPKPRPAEAAPQAERQVRVPSVRPKRRRPWMRVLAATLVIAAGALAVVLASGGGDDEEPARPPAARSPDSPSPEPAGGERLEWPARGDGYTVVVAISEDGRGPALARARRARRLGLDAGVLNSSDYSSLEPGKTVAFVGIFLNRSAARKEADRVERLGLTQAPYVVFVNGAG